MTQTPDADDRDVVDIGPPAGNGAVVEHDAGVPDRGAQELPDAFLGVASHVPTGRGRTDPGDQRHDRRQDRPEAAAAHRRVASSTPFEFGVGGRARMPEFDAPWACGVVDHGLLAR